MNAQEVYELTTRGGATVFACAVEACQRAGPYCLVGGFAVSCFVEPAYSGDAHLVIEPTRREALKRELLANGFQVDEFPHSLNAQAPPSELRIQFTTDPRYQAFLARAEDKPVLGVMTRVARLEDVVQGKLWAYLDPQRRMTKRKKDELDLLRLAEKYPHLKEQYPPELRKQLES